MICEKCGKQIAFLGVNLFNHDGSDGYWNLPLMECKEDAAYVETDCNWTGYELSEEEKLDTIRCPNCKQFPFKNSEIQVYDIVRMVFFKTDNGLDAIDNAPTVAAEPVRLREMAAEIERLEAERDRFKVRAEALESEVLARGCITCKHRGTRSLTVPCVRCNMASEWEWRGPQEGANP